MKLNLNLPSLAVSAVIGIAIGWLGGPVFALIWWGLIGLVIGAFSRGWKAALANGSVYGFTLSFVFMLHGYTGSAPVISVLLLFVVLGVFGATCGLSLAVAASVTRPFAMRFMHKTN